VGQTMDHRLAPQLAEIEHALFQQSFDGVIVADDDANYVHANAAACKLFGTTYDELVGSRVYGFAPDASQEVVNAQWRAFIEEGEQYGIFDVHRPDGSVQRAAFRARANVIPGFHVSFMTPIETIDIPVHENGERILTICAWSKRVKFGDRWASIEEFITTQLDLKISHGLSPQSAAKILP
jgi:PAS domain S-box-containing protein